MSTGARAIALTVLLVVVGASILRGVAASGDKNPIASVENGAPRGLLALRLLLEKRGVDVRVRRGDADPAPPPGALVIVPPPEHAAPSQDDVAQLLAHVRAGGALLVVCDDDGARTDRLKLLLSTVGAGCEPAEVAIGDTAETHAIGVLPGFMRAVTVSGLGRARTLADHAAVPAMMVGTDPLVAVRALDASAVIVVGSATVFANDGLGLSENAALLLDRVRASGATGETDASRDARVVVVDQRFHVPRARTAFAAASARGAGPTTMTLALALLVPLSLLALAPRRGDLSLARADDGAPAAEAQARALAALLVRARGR